MKRLLAMILLLAPTAVLMSDEPAAPVKKTDIKKIAIIDELEGGVRDIAKLPAGFDQVVRLLNFESASYVVENDTLKIGFDSPEHAAGDVIARLEFRSDCANNSQFRVTDAMAQRESVKEALVQWTRNRHKAPDAPLKIVKISAWQREDSGFRNFDVQLRIDKVSLLE